MDRTRFTMRTVKLIARFYSEIFLANFLVTLSCIGLMFFYGALAHKIVAVLCWYKAIAMIMIFNLSVYYKTRELYYYQNLGVSKLMLGVATSVFDFLLFAILFTITYNR